MSIHTPTEYYEEKMVLLKRLLSTSEELYSQSSDLDAVNSLIEEREHLIQEIVAFEATHKSSWDALLDGSQKEEINRLVSIISQLDQETRTAIEAEKDKLSKEMRTNTNKQKIAHYLSEYKK